MFTGIIENIGIVKSRLPSGSNLSLWIEAPFASALKVDQSLSHNGVCLTVEETNGVAYKVTAIRETLDVSNLGTLREGDLVNLERCLPLNGRLDGHIVQGHVEALGTCISIQPLEGSWEMRFRFPKDFAALVVEKGSICLNGISLTAFDVTEDAFTVAIIPYTYQNTNIRKINTGDLVNLEFDIIGKYVRRITSLNQ
ncbi:MAG TPA: riboflavin synthase [Flavitalea sp.]|nr:riboflavin synthase [Flavitalea sp.]